MPNELKVIPINFILLYLLKNPLMSILTTEGKLGKNIGLLILRFAFCLVLIYGHGSKNCQ